MVKCQYHEGCTEENVPDWQYAWGDPDSTTYLCQAHATAVGFCWMCGNFVGGTEDFFRTEGTGLCFDCYLYTEREEYMLDYDDDGEAWDDDDE